MNRCDECFTIRAHAALPANDVVPIPSPPPVVEKLSSSLRKVIAQGWKRGSVFVSANAARLGVAVALVRVGATDDEIESALLNSALLGSAPTIDAARKRARAAGEEARRQVEAESKGLNAERFGISKRSPLQYAARQVRRLIVGGSSLEQAVTTIARAAGLGEASIRRAVLADARDACVSARARMGAMHARRAIDQGTGFEDAIESAAALYDVSAVRIAIALATNNRRTLVRAPRGTGR